MEVRLSRTDRAELEARVRPPMMPQRELFRTQIVLLAAAGRSTRSIARELNTMPRRVSLWRRRSARETLTDVYSVAITLAKTTGSYSASSPTDVPTSRSAVATAAARVL